MTITAFAPRSVAAVVESYVASRRGAMGLVSTAEAVRAIRYLLPDCEHTNREFVELIAACAVRQGRNVAFDLPDESGGAYSELLDRVA